MNFIHRQKLEPSKSHSENIIWFLNWKKQCNYWIHIQIISVLQTKSNSEGEDEITAAESYLNGRLEL